MAVQRPAGALSYSGKFAAHAPGMPLCLWLGFSCLPLFMYTCTCTHSLSSPLALSLSLSHTLPWTICSPMTRRQYRSIIYLRPLTLRIRSRFGPIMAGLAQHPASIKAYSNVPLTHTHTHTHTPSSHNDEVGSICYSGLPLLFVCTVEAAL